MSLRHRIEKLEQRESSKGEPYVFFLTIQGDCSNRFDYHGQMFTRLEGETDEQLQARILGPNPRCGCIHVIQQTQTPEEWSEGVMEQTAKLLAQQKK